MFKWLKWLSNHTIIRTCDRFDSTIKRDIENGRLTAEFARQPGNYYKHDFYAIRRANSIKVFYPIYDKPYVSSFTLDEKNPTHNVGEFVISLDKNMRVLIETTNERLLRQEWEREVKEHRMQLTEQLRNLLRAEPDLIQAKEQFFDACQMFFDKPKERRRKLSIVERQIILNSCALRPTEIPVDYPKCNK